jgi:hypothetical protein
LRRSGISVKVCGDAGISLSCAHRIERNNATGIEKDST